MSPSNHRRKYDSFIINLYTQNKEYLLPEGFRKSIPHSTISTWRNLDYTSYHGHQFRNIQQEGLGYCEIFLKYKNLKRTFSVISRIWVSVSDVLQPVITKSKIHGERFIDEVQRLFTVLPRETALKVAGFTSSAFEYRLSKIKNQCTDSPLSLCFKRHPLQLSVREIRSIKNLLTDEQLACWPLSSVYWYGKRTGQLFVGLSTFYKYAGMLGLKRKVKRPSAKTKGIQADRPNQFLHVDTTFWTLPNNIKYAIVFVSDNFSKTILGWSIARNKTAENVMAALKIALQTMREHHDGQINSALIADGGSENHAYSIEEFILKTQNPDITKLIAGKHIRFSNSPIEAINKIAKRYLRHHDPSSYSKLNECLEHIVHDYSFVRPHGSLNGIIPMEAYTQKSPKLDFTEQIAKAKVLRIAQNRNSACGICSTE